MCLFAAHTRNTKKRGKDNDILWATAQLDISFMCSAPLLIFIVLRYDDEHEIFDLFSSSKFWDNQDDSEGN